ncbi:hypothetical protein ACFO25_10065 [Paenactinomyces guangxiensis]|uniref:Uncharacterized protein n=1 Tax=Paenactinomyces guangxiensis TaxID=1490290 RepID=A0A7W1WS81_9BACL|nr:hypothetical protein [Paenactinomyces guangxiensis]MBA4495130.1 hypothetical protein [Paenactinomyces guangxiensis]MBH8592186.1 hypothetical protein [Paenactinomyces guangxiensis]
MGLKQKYCPDCKTVPVSFVLGASKPGKPAKDFYHCSNCNENFSADFKGFIKRPIKPRKAFAATTYLTDKSNRRAYDAHWF